MCASLARSMPQRTKFGLHIRINEVTHEQINVISVQPTILNRLHIQQPAWWQKAFNQLILLSKFFQLLVQAASV